MQNVCVLPLTALWYNFASVTPRQRRHKSRYFSRYQITVQGGFGTCFCRHGINLIEHHACRSTRLIQEPRIYPRLQSWLRALVQCRGEKLIAARKLLLVTEF